ncbi:hypothetical protein MrNuV_ORF025 [Macrobrachium rosenbergii nudivirus]|nr:hypothetical protein MrNuV_ORF025 [Macrobrachium rosenbergii nudivirus]
MFVQFCILLLFSFTGGISASFYYDLGTLIYNPNYCKITNEFIFCDFKAKPINVIVSIPNCKDGNRCSFIRLDNAVEVRYSADTCMDVDFRGHKNVTIYNSGMECENLQITLVKSRIHNIAADLKYANLNIDECSIDNLNMGYPSIIHISKSKIQNFSVGANCSGSIVSMYGVYVGDFKPIPTTLTKGTFSLHLFETTFGKFPFNGFSVISGVSKPSEKKKWSTTSATTIIDTFNEVESSSSHVTFYDCVIAQYILLFFLYIFNYI